MGAFQVGAFEPAPPAGPELGMPPFPVVLRGFDRQQMEAWSRQLASQVQQERLRADQAEQALYRMRLQQPATRSFTHLGAHLGDVLEEAGRSAEKLLVDAAQRAQEAIDAAAAEAAQMITAAEHRAAQIEQAAHQTPRTPRPSGPGLRARPGRRPRSSAPGPSRTLARCWSRPGRRPRRCGSRGSGSGWRSRPRPGSCRRCGSGPRMAPGNVRPPGVGA